MTEDNRDHWFDPFPPGVALHQEQMIIMVLMIVLMMIVMMMMMMKMNCLGLEKWWKSVLNFSFESVAIMPHIIELCYVTLCCCHVQFTYKADKVQLTFLQLLSSGATQNITFHCRNTVAYFDKKQKTFAKAAIFRTYNDLELVAKKSSKFKYDVASDNCKVCGFYSQPGKYLHFFLWSGHPPGIGFP